MSKNAIEYQPDEHLDLIVLRAKDGDQKAFMDLVGRYSGMLYAAAYAILQNKEDAEDTVQDAFIKAHKYLHSLGDSKRIAPWLRSIVRQECYGFIRLCKRKISLLSQSHLAELWQESSSSGEHPDTVAFQNELWARSMRVLSQRAREIVLLYYLEGYTCVQIAELLYLSEGAVKSHLHKARKKIETNLRRIGIHSPECLG